MTTSHLLNKITLSSYPELTYHAWLAITAVVLAIVFTFFGFSLSINFKQRTIKLPFNYATVPFLLSLVLLTTQTLTGSTYLSSLLGDAAIQPWTLLLILLSMAYICQSLDATGLLEYVSLRILSLSGTSGHRLFFNVFFLTAFMTLIIANDIVILTLTHIIIYIAQHTQTDPWPYLFIQFYAANTMGLIWYMGNTTNLLVTFAFHLDALTYTKIMAVPTLVFTLTTLVCAYLYFYTVLPAHLPTLFTFPPTTVLKRPWSGVIILVIWTLCLSCLFAAPWIAFPIWWLVLMAAGLVFLLDLFWALLPWVYKHVFPQKKLPTHTGWRPFRALLIHLPFPMISFSVGMFALIEALKQHHVLVYLGQFTAFLETPSALWTTCTVTLVTMGVSWMVTNLPMTLLFTYVYTGTSSTNRSQAAIYAMIYASNVAVCVIWSGALAGFLWVRLLKKKDLHLRPWEFIKKGLFIMTIPILSGAFSLGAILIALK